MEKTIKIFAPPTIKICSYLILFIPLLLIKSTFFPFTFPKIIFFRILVEISFAAWIFSTIYLKESRLQLRETWMLLLSLFVALVMGSMISGVDIRNSFWSSEERMTGVFTLLHLWAWLTILSARFRQWVDWKKLLLLSILICLSTEAIGIYELINIKRLDHSRIYSTLGNPIYLGIYSALNVFLSIFLILRNKNIFQSLFLTLFILFSLSMVLLTGSRGVAFSLIASIIVLFLISFLVLSGKKSKFIVLSILMFIFISVTASIIWLDTKKGMEWGQKTLPLPLTRILYNPINNDRFALWTIGLRGFKERKFLGWGWENFNLIYNKYYDPIFKTDLREPWYDRSHNQLIDILALTGIAGFLSYIAFWVALFYALIKKLKNEIEPRKRCSIATLIALFVFYFLQNLFVFDSPVPLIIFYFSLGLTHFTVTEEQKESADKKKLNLQIKKQNIPDIAKKIPATILLFFTIVLSSATIYYCNILPLQKNMLGLEAYKTISSNFRKGLELYRQSLSSSSFTNPKIRNELIKSVLLNFNNQKVLKEDLKIGIDFALQESNKNIKEHPHEVRYYLASSMLYRAALLYDLTSLDKAEELMKKALLISPKRPEIAEELKEISRIKSLYQQNQQIRSSLEKKG
ncbi:MAG: hypothetical protein A3I11_04100 [Elusimicrobia bacterium RIFCSPLOWO2_02_FULL_39_32]|nr:MAG: hypothetical protein A3B80_02675 [Elusimicrobia bacterium RIFCSPHIGHO2_02_FULL_39_36]OGR92882.1 MAG: hypothetical protein A3I11_04100 [Elusimicrobia bacterium RIFCSPLOWO2_02_FULL_39_32]OGR99666.1 MAG: hypothetical protein A3G85_01465 [Elusimicrobia bacterium RIFCSPLOWO2_12_FULL_39_28]